MNDCRICVVKIGGSLLTSEKLSQRLREWLAAEIAIHEPTHYALIVGGGPLADAIRQFDALNDLDEDTAHWICVELLDMTARLVAAMLPEIWVSDDYERLAHRCREPGVTIFQPSQFLKEVKPKRAGTRLPADWTVTSDAIAARLAIVLRADEIVLIKSTLPPESSGVNVDQLAAIGYVDSFLPHLVGEMPPLRLATLDMQTGA